MALPKPDHRFAFGLLFAISMLTASGNTALQAVLAVIGRQIGVRDSLIAGVFSLSSLLWTFSSPAWARASDLHGRKRMVMVGLAGFSLSMAVFSVVVFAGVDRWIGPATASAPAGSRRRPTTGSPVTRTRPTQRSSASAPRNSGRSNRRRTDCR